MRGLTLALAFVILSGCGATSAPIPQQDNIVVTVELVDGFDNPSKLAETKWNPLTPGICQIKIRRDVYPNCVTHEIMHCYSGNWHEGYETDRYCYVK